MTENRTKKSWIRKSKNAHEVTEERSNWEDVAAKAKKDEKRRLI